MSWWARQPEALRDAVGAGAIVLIFLIAQQRYGDGGSAARAIAIVSVMGIALTFRRRWPVATYLAALLTAAIATTGLEFLGIAGYTLVAHEPRARPALVTGATGLALGIGHLRYWPSLRLDDVAGDLITIVAIAVLPVFFGRAVRMARQTTSELELRNTELEALREQAAEHAVETERFRIARELHDVVAHHVSAMTVRARAGHHVAPRDPQAAADALSYVAEAGTEALTAMGTFVGSLRGEAGAGGGDLAPQPGLESIPALLQSFRGTGLVVHEDLDHPPAALGAAVGLNAYRIVQEALTNAIRHGAAERAWVRLRLAAGMLHICVDDNGRGLPTRVHRAGHGLIGIAERAALHGGTSALGPSPRGGCRLEATLAAGPAARPEPAAPDATAARP